MITAFKLIRKLYDEIMNLLSKQMKRPFQSLRKGLGFIEKLIVLQWVVVALADPFCRFFPLTAI